MNAATQQSRDPVSVPEWLEIVREKVESLAYGVVQIVVHDRKITLIERTDKTRLDAPVNETARPNRRDAR